MSNRQGKAPEEERKVGGKLKIITPRKDPLGRKGGSPSGGRN